MFKPVYSPNLSLTEIRYLSGAILEFLSNDKNLQMLDALFEERYNLLYRDTIGDERRAHVYSWNNNNGYKIGKFYTFTKNSLIEDRVFNSLLIKIFGDVDLNTINIQALTGGNYLLPHVDLGNRNSVVKNFPIYNFENSESIFFKFKPTTNINYPAFTFDELEEVARFKYTPNFVHEFDASIPHSVYSTHSGFRLMLSCYS